MVGRDVGISGRWSAVANHFQFVATCECWGGVGHKSVFGREGNPIDVVGKRMRAVGFHSYEFSNLVQGFNQRVSEEERGLSSCDDNVVSRIFQYFRYDVGFFLLHSRFVCGVAEEAFEIAST